jgi:hypothetical protein
MKTTTNSPLTFTTLTFFLMAAAWAAAAAPSTNLCPSQPDFQSRHLAVGFSRSAPAFTLFTLDALGQGKLENNPVQQTNSPDCALEFVTVGPGRFAYVIGPAGGNGPAAWEVACDERTLTLRSRFAPGADNLPFRLRFDQKANHATLLGLMEPGERGVALPALLHLPDLGSARIRSNRKGAKLDFDARRYVKPPFVEVFFPPATASERSVEYRLEVAAVHPKLRGIEKEALFDGFRRSYLNILQVNPRVGMLANNSSSDPCAFTLFKYSEIARRAPVLVDGLTALDLVRMSLDRYLAGALAYGQVGYGTGNPGGADIIGWGSPYDSADSYPSLLIGACNYAQGAKDWKWARANYDALAAWGRRILATDRDGNGLIEYPTGGIYGERPGEKSRPSNWWDTINFGHEDAYANALAYRAATQFAQVARKLGQRDDAEFFAGRAAKLRRAYLPAFLNPATGVLAGWRSADGQLHDYWFTFVNGMAITFGLVDDKDANAILDRLLAKMTQVGFTNFSLGLPGNLIPVRKGDYIFHGRPPEVFGEPQLEDGSDGFQFYENGGATACHAYFTVKALYQLGRTEDARRIFEPMLRSFAAGDFQGFCDDGMSKDWRDWSGGCHGYEGFLVDSFLPLLAVFDEWEARGK